MSEHLQILDPRTGEPFKKDAMPIESTESAYSSFVDALFGRNTSSLTKTLKPLNHHNWFYAAAMIRAVNLAQAPLYVYRETDEQEDDRRRLARKNGKVFAPKYGRKRAFVQRHLRGVRRFHGFPVKAMEIDLEHDISAVLWNPNPLISQSSLIQITSLWLSMRGESIWLKNNLDGTPVEENASFDELWPMSPDLFKPVVKSGRLLGWWFHSMNDSDPRGHGYGERIPIMPWEVIQFKYANPENPVRGISPITAAALGINTDLMADEHNRAVLSNGADPGGILTYEGEELDGDEEAEFLSKWENRHKGPANKRRISLIHGGWKYTPTGLSPQDMEFLEQKRWNRDAIFAILRVPKSVAGITEQLNYATQLGQDKNLWDKSLLPDVRLIEDVLDMTLFEMEPDTLSAAFDLSNIEALRHGFSEQVDTAIKLMGAGPHMPPRLAFEMSGINDVPEYIGDDVSFIPALNSVPVEDVLNPDDPPPPPPPDDPTPEEDEDRDDEVLDPDQVDDEVVTEAGGGVVRKNARWLAFVKTQEVVERSMKGKWRRWMKEEKRLTLERFDELYGKKNDSINVDSVIVPIEDIENRGRAAFAAQFQSALEITYDLVSSEIAGLPVFELDDPRLIEAMNKRLNLLTGSVPKTLQRQLRESLLSGVANGETLSQLRQRVSLVFKNQLSAAKTLQIARTESAGFMNLARSEMFSLQGFTKLEWITAGDENVRDSHAFFGSVGPQASGTNYLELSGYPGAGTGVLSFPGDTGASANEVVNCRCVQVPVE